MICTNKTNAIINLCLLIAKYAEKNNLWYFFGGGLAIDLQKGNLNRDHDDIDFYPLDKDTDTWKNFFKESGFTVNEDSEFKDFPNAFIANKDEVLVETLPVKILEDQSIAMNWRNEEYGRFYNKTLADIVETNFQNQLLKVEGFTTVLNQKLIESNREKTPLREKDLIDFKTCGVILRK